MISNKKKFLIIGTGSIGRRHIGLFSKFYDIDIVDTNPSRLKLANKLFKISNSFLDYKKAIQNNSYIAIAICTPPHMHLKIAKLAVKFNNNLFIEKPLGMNSKGWKEVSRLCKNKKLVNYVAYCHRFVDYFQKARQLIAKNKIGKVHHANMRWGSYLPDWHPWEKYYNFYMAKKNQGGGALLDESHGIDLIRFFLGEVEEVSAFVDKVSSLKINSDDLAMLNLKLKGNKYVHVNFDLLARYPRNNFEIIGSKGTIVVDRVDHTLRIFDINQKKWKVYQYKKENMLSMYDKQASYFVKCLKSKKSTFIDINDALKTQNVIDASFLSSKLRKNIKI